MQTLLLFLRNEDGTTAIEYGMIAAGLSVAVVLSVNQLGVDLNEFFFERIPEALAEVTGDGPEG
ncbi:MAG: Flp family type IVb pilin [Pseudomonadota bacterium]